MPGLGLDTKITGDDGILQSMFFHCVLIAISCKYLEKIGMER